MKRSRFTEEQIIAILREQETGVATVGVCRRHGISSASARADMVVLLVDHQNFRPLHLPPPKQL